MVYDYFYQRLNILKSIKYSLIMKINLIPKWQVKSHTNIKLTANRIVYNSKTNRIKKITSNGGSIGIWLDNKTFLVKSKLKENIELHPKKEYTPF